MTLRACGYRIGRWLGILLLCTGVEAATLMIRLENPAGQPGLERLDQRAFIYGFSDERAWIQFSFERRPFDEADAMETIRETFKYCNVEVRFPERGTESSRVYAQLRGPLRDLDTPRSYQNMRDLELSFLAFDRGRLRGTIRGAITRLTTETRDPGAISGDIAGVRRLDQEVEIPFLIEFDLSVD